MAVAARILWVGQNLAVNQYVAASFSPAGEIHQQSLTQNKQNYIRNKNGQQNGKACPTHVVSASEFTTTVWRY